MAINNNPITEKQVATFVELIEQGMLQHLEDTANWSVVDKIYEFISKFTSLKNDEVYTTSTNAAEYFWERDKHRDLLEALCYEVQRSNDSSEERELLGLVAEIFDIEDCLVDSLDRYPTKNNRKRITSLLELREWATDEEIIEELKQRI